jgi:predicted esterase
MCAHWQCAHDGWHGSAHTCIAQPQAPPAPTIMLPASRTPCSRPPLLLLLLLGLVARRSENFAHAQARPKILCLHGGGQSASAFQSDPGMMALRSDLSGYDFVYASGAYPGNLWIRDPPGGKGAATTDPHWASASMTALDTIVATQGPFYGILGYSQGSAFVPVYLSHAPAGTFHVAFMFCGYLTTTHTGILNQVNAASPFGGIPALIWMGANDYTIANSLSQQQATIFTTPTVIASSSGGHAVPTASDPTYSQVVAFMQVRTRNGTGGGGSVNVGTPKSSSSCRPISNIAWIAFAAAAVTKLL